MVAVGTYTYSQPADTHVPTLYGLIQEVLVDGPVTLLECFILPLQLSIYGALKISN
jgi:hypothetical protein